MYFILSFIIQMSTFLRGEKIYKIFINHVFNFSIFLLAQQFFFFFFFAFLPISVNTTQQMEK